MAAFAASQDPLRVTVQLAGARTAEQRDEDDPVKQS
jgi:hypothetical protein